MEGGRRQGAGSIPGRNPAQWAAQACVRGDRREAGTPAVGGLGLGRAATPGRPAGLGIGVHGRVRTATSDSPCRGAAMEING